MKKTIKVANSATSKVRSSRSVGRQLLDRSERLRISIESSRPWNMTVSDSGSCRHNDRMKNSPKLTTRTSDAARSLCWRSPRVSVTSWESSRSITRCSARSCRPGMTGPPPDRGAGGPRLSFEFRHGTSPTGTGEIGPTIGAICVKLDRIRGRAPVSRELRLPWGRNPRPGSGIPG